VKWRGVGVHLLEVSVTGSTVLTGLKEDQSRRTSGTRKDFLGTRHAPLSQFSISFARPASIYCDEYVSINTHLTANELYEKNRY